MTVAELRAILLTLPQEVTVVYADSQHGDCKITHVLDTETYCDGVRVVRIS